MTGSYPLIRVDNLKKHFPVRQGLILQRQVATIKAVDDVSFTITQGETLGLVGESGSGKTTLGQTLLQLQRPTSGSVFYRDHDLMGLSGKDLRQVRRHLQMIFQDPYSSLNPRMRVQNIIAEPLEVHAIGTRQEQRERVEVLLDLVGLHPSFKSRYPHEFSGGQRQRIGIARALATEPEFIVCDEPVSSLDVSIQAQVVNLLQEMQEMFNLSYLFIAHDLSIVRHISDRMAVMYLGKIVELAPRVELHSDPLHPYTQALLQSVPLPDPRRERSRQRIVLEGEIPSPAHPPPGCRFHTRCPIAESICKEVEPEWREMSQGHWVACHLA